MTYALLVEPRVKKRSFRGYVILPHRTQIESTDRAPCPLFWRLALWLVYKA